MTRTTAAVLLVLCVSVAILCGCPKPAAAPPVPPPAPPPVASDTPGAPVASGNAAPEAIAPSPAAAPSAPSTVPEGSKPPSMGGYPGSKVVTVEYMEGTNTVTLETTDASSKVIKFYRSKYGATDGLPPGVTMEGKVLLGWTKGGTDYTVVVGKTLGNNNVGINLIWKGKKWEGGGGPAAQ